MSAVLHVYPQPTTVERVARRVKHCDGCHERILTGDKYLEHRMPPSRRLGNTTWLTTNECLACAGRLGRRADQALEHFATPLFDVEPIA